MPNYISHRYYPVIRLLVVGMGAASVLPWLVLFGNRWANRIEPLPPFSGDIERYGRIVNGPWILLFLAIWVLMFGFLWLFDWTNKWLNAEDNDQLLWRTVMVTLMILIIFPVNRLVLYSYAQAPLFIPARGILNSVFNFTDGIRPENSLIAIYMAAWLFVIWVTSNALGYMEIGRAFQLGLIASLTGLGILARQGEIRFSLFVPFLVCGLAALSVAQIDSRISNGHHSPGRYFTRIEMSHLAISILGMVGAGSLLANLVAPELIRAIIQPILRFIVIVFEWIVWTAFIILEPIARVFFTIFESIFSGVSFDFISSGSNSGTDQAQDLNFTVFEEIIQIPRYRYLIVGVAVAFVLLILWVVLNRTLLKRYRDSAETQQDEDAQPLQFDGFNRLRDWFNALRGRTPKTLLDPNTMENIYANLCRIADNRGFPRPVALPPDQYLPQLKQAFPGQDRPLQRITNGYMRTHYGEVDLPSTDLHEMIGDYQSILSAVEEEAEN